MTLMSRRAVIVALDIGATHEPREISEGRPAVAGSAGPPRPPITELATVGASAAPPFPSPPEGAMTAVITDAATVLAAARHPRPLGRASATQEGIEIGPTVEIISALTGLLAHARGDRPTTSPSGRVAPWSAVVNRQAGQPRLI